MGFVFCVGTCFGCKGPMTFNPNLVPSISINGVKEPICKTCVDKVNPVRIKNGLEPIVLHPDAYSAANESEINWGQS